MSRVAEVSRQIAEALRARESDRLAALRSIRAAFLNEMKKDGASELADEVELALLRRLEKQHLESIAAFEGAGRTELAEREKAELAVIREFLPGLADEATTRGWVEAAVAETGASGPRDLGRVMGALMKKHKGEVDGDLARRLVTERLGG
jgi:hypothetical protein